eukprot:GHVT01040794.1.p1 GENE.GHVT01040794.1~~GHVT01040794.1.p1  ORF type:complete len:372 (-),score=82.49 GHVT01040794.1:1210-2325(-)
MCRLAMLKAEDLSRLASAFSSLRHYLDSRRSFSDFLELAIAPGSAQTFIEGLSLSAVQNSCLQIGRNKPNAATVAAPTSSADSELTKPPPALQSPASEAAAAAAAASSSLPTFEKGMGPESAKPPHLCIPLSSTAQPGVSVGVPSPQRAISDGFGNASADSGITSAVEDEEQEVTPSSYAPSPVSPSSGKESVGSCSSSGPPLICDFESGTSPAPPSSFARAAVAPRSARLGSMSRLSMDSYSSISSVSAHSQSSLKCAPLAAIFPTKTVASGWNKLANQLPLTSLVHSQGNDGKQTKADPSKLQVKFTAAVAYALQWLLPALPLALVAGQLFAVMWTWTVALLLVVFQATLKVRMNTNQKNSAKKQSDGN